MTASVTNIGTAGYQQGESDRGEPPWRFLDLSGEHLGVRIEELPPGGTSSHHHYHSAEEEHVLVLEGTATLYLGEREVVLENGDHICFPAGDAVAHHMENTSAEAFRFLVFGERKKDDVVFYPDAGVMLVKSGAGSDQYTYRERKS